MKTINTINQTGVKFTLYPDNQPHVNITTAGLIPGDDVRLVCPIRNSNELVQLLEITDAINNAFANKVELVIPYLMAARFDRVMQPGDSLDLKVVANLINLCQFQRVNLFDAHSDVATALINHSKNHNNSRLVKAYNMPSAVLICLCLPFIIEAALVVVGIVLCVVIAVVAGTVWVMELFMQLCLKLKKQKQ